MSKKGTEIILVKFVYTLLRTGKVNVLRMCEYILQMFECSNSPMDLAKDQSSDFLSFRWTTNLRAPQLAKASPHRSGA